MNLAATPLLLVNTVIEGVFFMLMIKHFTHTDLDGLGCAAVSTYHFKNTGKVVFSPCGYKTVDERVKNFLSGDTSDFDLIFITDISVNEEVAEIIQGHYEKNKNIQLIDHHETALWLNKYEWANVEVNEGKDKLASGTSLLNRYLKDSFYQPNMIEAGIVEKKEFDVVDDFSEVVRLYDTWEWHERGIETPLQLNDLMGVIGFGRFVERFGSDPTVMFNGMESAIVKRIARERENYINTKLDQVSYQTLQLSDIVAIGELEVDDTIIEAFQEFTQDMNETNPALGLSMVMVERFHSEVGNAIAEARGGVVLMLDVNRGSMSFRTAADELKVNRLAKMFGGGGHVKAAGAPLSVPLTKYYLTQLMDTLT